MYSGLVESISNNDTNKSLSEIGKKIILPSSFVGSPRYMHQLYQDAMSVVRAFGKPDLFITFTCNPQWNEIVESLKPFQKPSDRPDLIVRVFRLKFKNLLHDLLKKSIFGKVVGYIYVIEFQKRGLPHGHILLILDENSKPKTVSDYDNIVCAEIPDKTKFPKLYETVAKNMVHGPCGKAFPSSPCMENGKCSKQFPKDFSPFTYENNNGFFII